MQIEHVEVIVVAPERRRYSWSHDLPEQYQTNTLMRIRTDAGVEGVAAVWNAASHAPEHYTAESLRHLIPDLLGRDPLMREQIRHDLRPRVFPQPPGAIALIDIALWDLLGKLSGQPLYRLLGGARDRIRAYASTPMLEDVPAYLRFVDTLLEQGFRAVKFHTWCVPERDLALAREVRRVHPDERIELMLDAENNYDRNGALRVGQELEDLGFTWLEAPLPDHDLEGYRELCRHLRMPVIPSGNWIQDLPSFREALQTRCWKVARSDVTMLGGLTPGAKAMAIAQSFGASCEIMSWGHSLASAANLHLMLAFPNCTYYEQPLPHEAYEYGMREVLRTAADGFITAPAAPGLGLEVDWEAMMAGSVYRIASDEL